MRRLVTIILFAALACGALTLAAAERHALHGTVVDGSGHAVAGARVVLHAGKALDRETVTDRAGAFTFLDVAPGANVSVLARGFQPGFVELDASHADVRIVLEPAALSEEITVVGAPAMPRRSSTATKTDTPLRDVPQAVTVVTRDVIRQQTMKSMADVARYVPGVGFAQGEGNRDNPIFRGNSSTAAFFVDGVRDDVQYLRDLYNVDRVEALKGPNAMIFGRGGVGGVINRVTRQAEWTPSREVSLEGGSFDDRRATADFGQAVSDNVAARVVTFFERSGSYRNDVDLERYGINPTIAFTLGNDTMLRAGYEHFHDDRTADRGITSFAGRPVATDPSTFFGNSDASRARATVDSLNVSLDHRINEHASLRSHVSYGDYDKFYQNIFAGTVDASGTNVNLNAYNNATQRRNLFGQTDLVVTGSTGRIAHTLLGGFEIGRQVTDNFRNTGYFTSVGPNATSLLVPLSNPVTSQPVTFRQSATDADNHGIATSVSLYVQDQIVLTRHLQAIAGVRFDDFRMDFTNRRNATNVLTRDHLVSPRLGLIFKPADAVSAYVSYSLAYLPRAGEQLSSLTVTNQSLEPEQFRNYEAGLKWDVAQRLELTGAVYRLDRSNVAAADPTNPAITTLVAGQRTKGVEVSAAGNVTNAWSIVGAYAFQDGEITRSISTTALAGARLAQLPRHSASLWNKWDASPAWSFGAGVIRQDSVFTSTDNTVTLPAFTRVDAAIFWTISPRVRAQLNVENLFDRKYYLYANSNTNITPGSPRAVRLTWTSKF